MIYKTLIYYNAHRMTSAQCCSYQHSRYRYHRPLLILTWVSGAGEYHHSVWEHTPRPEEGLQVVAGHFVLVLSLGAQNGGQFPSETTLRLVGGPRRRYQNQV